MRLCLSSFKMGNHPDQLAVLAPPGTRTSIVVNALDKLPRAERVQIRRATCGGRGSFRRCRLLEIYRCFGPPKVPGEGKIASFKCTVGPPALWIDERSALELRFG